VDSDAAAPAPAPDDTTERFRRLKIAPLLLWPIAALVIAIPAIRMSPRAGRGVAVAILAFAVYGLLFVVALRSIRKAGIPVSEVLGSLPARATAWLRALAIVPPLLITDLMLVWLCLLVAALVAPRWTAALLSRVGFADMLPTLSPLAKAVFVLMACVVAPIVEELVFRGLLLRRFIASRGFWGGIVSSGAIFAVLHPQQLFGAFLSAVILSLLYLASRSLLVPIVAHAFANALVTIATLSAAGAKPRGSAVAQLAELRAMLVPNLTVLLIAGSIVFFLARPLEREAREHTRA
jgi:uncharacterized protein